MIPGILCIASGRGVPGTAGALVRNVSGRQFLLTTYHVAFGGGAETGERVWAIAPEPNEYGQWEAVCLGRTSTGQIGRVTFAGETYFVDCALVELVGEEEFKPWLSAVLNDTWPAQPGAIEAGGRVFKHGAATGTTEGVLVDVAYPDQPVIDGRSWEAPGQLLVNSRDPQRNFSAPGDSGAALLDEQGHILGLLWGANASGQGIACPIAPALDCLGVTLDRIFSPTPRGP